MAAQAGARLPTRPLGNTGLEVSVLGFGASPLGSVFQVIDEDVGVQAVHAAFHAGINFFDTSPFYGATKSETVLGRALATLPREQFILSTKVGRYGQSQADFDFSAERVVRSVEESLARLQVPYIDVIQCHDIEFGSLDQIVSETLPALQSLKSKGLVRHLGITGLPLNIFQQVMDKVPPGTVDVALSYCHHCLNDHSLLDILPYLREKQVGVVNASPLAMGLLTQQGPPSWHPAPKEVQEACKRAASHAASRGVDIANLALEDAVRNTDIATTLVGMHTPDLVSSNVNSVLEALGVQTRDPSVEELHLVVLREVKEILSPVHNITWPSGRPENN